MKKIKVKFCDFWPNFDYSSDPIWQSLKRNGYEIKISSSPDYVIYSGFGHEHLKYDCIQIFYTGENETPDFNVCDYAVGFDYLEFGERYFRFPFYCHPGYNEKYELMLNKHKGIPCHQEFCSFVYSNSNANPIRQKFFEQLSAYKRVNSGGRLLNNVGGAVQDKLEFEKTHKFSIAFENASYPGYTTEKIMESFAAQTIPIYWGDPRIGEEFNAKAFINISDFDSIDAAVQYIQMIDQNDELYRSIIAQPAMLQDVKMNLFQRFDRFIDHIFSQDVALAHRTSGDYWNKNYVKNKLTMEDMLQRKMSYNRVQRVVQKLFNL